MIELGSLKTKVQLYVIKKNGSETFIHIKTIYEREEER